MPDVLDVVAIEGILPHRGRALLIQEAISGAHGISGKVVITEQMCEGHEMEGKFIFRGTDFGDMAAQLLGIVCALDNELRKKLHGLSCRLRKSVVVCHNEAYPGDVLTIVLQIEDVQVSGRSGTLFVAGENFIVTRGDRKIATIEFVKLVFFVSSPDS